MKNTIKDVRISLTKGVQDLYTENMGAQHSWEELKRSRVERCSLSLGWRTRIIRWGHFSPN